jgi:xanthine/CO dehydrogenase XdhC/CoxF family maturation factor
MHRVMAQKSTVEGRPSSMPNSPSPIVADPFLQFEEKLVEMRKKGIPFALATVIEVIGSASARTGSKAIFSQDGVNLLGWVGGGCAERFVGEECVAALAEQRTRIVLADLDDEIFGLGVACGGKMRIFIEPILPAEVMPLPNAHSFESLQQRLSGFYGWNPVSDPSLPKPASVRAMFVSMALAAAAKRGLSGIPLRAAKAVPAQFIQKISRSAESICIVGNTRITEALARHFSILGIPVRVVAPQLNQDLLPAGVRCECLAHGYKDIHFALGEAVVVASHTSQDPAIVELAISRGAPYVAMVGSLKRAKEVLKALGSLNGEVNAPLYVPAGLDLGAKNPEEIALSVVAEFLLENSEGLYDSRN